MNFGEAVNQLQEGQMVGRSSWEPGKFVFRQIPTTLSIDIVPKMTSLPDTVKEIFLERQKHHGLDEIMYDNQFVSVNPSNLIQTWTPSVEDCEAEDWFIY